MELIPQYELDVKDMSYKYRVKFIDNKSHWYSCEHDCEIGDVVTLETSYVKQTYLVTQREVFHETDLTYIRPTDDDRLTMYTCWNNGRLGMSKYRLAIICELTKREWKDVKEKK